MFLLLALIVQIVQVVHGGRDCRLEKYNADFGQDFYNLTNVDSLSQCQDTCESERRCFGFTWGDGDKTVQPTLVERGRAAGRRRGRPRTAEEQAAMTDLIAAGETTNTLATRAQGQTRRRGTGRGSGVSVDREPARNCALYGKNGMVDGVLRHGQESYKCKCGTERPKITRCRVSGAGETRWTSSIAGIQGINSRGGIGVVSSNCNPRFDCMAKDGSNKCCHATRDAKYGCRRVYSCS